MNLTVATVRKRLGEKSVSDRISTFVVDNSSRDAIYAAAEATRRKARHPQRTYRSLSGNGTRVRVGLNKTS